MPLRKLSIYLIVHTDEVLHIYSDLFHIYTVLFTSVDCYREGILFMYLLKILYNYVKIMYTPFNVCHFIRIDILFTNFIVK